MTHTELEAYILSFPDTWLDWPFGEDVAVYKVGGQQHESTPHLGAQQIEIDDSLPSESRISQSAVDSATTQPGKMFALIAMGSKPVRVSLKCDPQLAETLREEYESVLSGYHLNKKHWNTIICSGQLDDEQIKDLIRHSYQLVVG